MSINNRPVSMDIDIYSGNPVIMDEGCFKISYREPILGGNRQAIHKTRTMMGAVNEFNTLERTSLSPEGLPFDTPLRIERINTRGFHTDTWTMDGRYATPRHMYHHTKENTR
jgi:hypothetical protein